MNIIVLNQDRKAFAKTLAEKAGLQSKYLGAPTFGYQVGPYLVKRDNTVEVDEASADLEILRELNLVGLIDNSWDEERETMDISIPIAEHNGLTLQNIIKMIYCREEIINQAIGCAGAFSIEEELIIKIAKAEPETAEDFIEAWNEAEGNCHSRGFELEDDKIHFSGFPMTTDPDEVRAYMELVSLIGQMALAQKRVNLEKPDITNEKYSFRVWLLRLGMKGDEYKLTRHILLSKLSGHSAFRTKEQEEIAKEKNKAARLQAKESE